MSHPCTLKRVLAYKNPELVARFKRDYGLPQKECERIFEDTLRFLWLCGRRDIKTQIVMFEPFGIIDEMWHNFVLYSCEYSEFCKRYFGCFIHHVPTPALPSRRKAEAKHGPTSVDPMLELVWHQLGADVARRWFYEYPRLYPKKGIKRLQLRAVA